MKRPPAIWRISTGDKARAVMPEAELVIFEPAKNLYGVVVSERTTLAADAFHASVVDATPGRKLPTQPIQLVEPALVSGADVDEDGASLRYRMYTMVKDGRGLKLMFWGTRGDVERYVGELDAAARGFAFDALPAIETHAGAYLDRRFGFDVDVPARWSFVDQSPKGSAAIQTFATWTHGPSLMGVLALELPVTDGDWFLDFVEQSIRDQMGPMVVGQARRSEATLGGQPARRLSWPELDAYVLARDGYIYGFITTADAPTSQAFRFVD
ncbi:MAG: hypothetical protein NT062_38350 [Proteobacteria bacterium]|nr:hypothetical protein [Pseudomonadota bacterium]